MLPLYPLGSRAETNDGCGIEAFGIVRVPQTELSQLRQDPGLLPGGRRLAFSSLRQADEQTLLGLTAVLRAIETFGLREREFGDWGVVAAPRFLGRSGAAVSLDRFRRRGIPGMSPLVIPTLSLHSVSGTVSMALGCHGPNFGAGGGVNHVAEGLLTGLAVREDGHAPGIWLVLTGFDPEPEPDAAGQTSVTAVGFGAALGLVAGAGASGLWLRIAAADRAAASVVSPSLTSLVDFLTARTTPASSSRWVCRFPAGLGIEISDEALDVALPERRRAG